MKILVLLLPAMMGAATFQVNGTNAAPWSKIFGAVGISQASGGPDIVVAGPDAQVDSKLAENHILILEGTGAAAASFGFAQKPETVLVRHICDVHAPKMQIVWEHPQEVHTVSVPDGFQIFATEKWKGIAVLAGKRTKNGAVLWMATGPGETGLETYPYLLQALVDLGLPLPARSTDLWAFFDSAYRIRADVDYLARRWRQSGISVLHVAAWHNMEPDPVQDAFLNKLIEACHRNAILVYAWLELPHVSDKFWDEHPEWREKTALGQDAQLDWRKLMNLQNPECHRVVAREVGELLHRFDWDGVNLAELYFESLEGAADPARFTPMNDDVRAQFKRLSGIDPKLLFPGGSPDGLQKFLDFRAELASRMQADWLTVVDQSRAEKPYLDVVLTHIDDRFEPDIRNALGADVARSLPLIRKQKSLLLVEDPATLWNLGPERYAKLAAKYSALGAPPDQLGIDINVVERYQDVYPTKKQTGMELLELVHQAAESFGQVALYFENSLEKQDLNLLPVAASTAKIAAKGVDELDIDTAEPARVTWQGPVELDGKVWPVHDARFVLVPAGKHRLTTGVENATVVVSDFNGEIQSAVNSKDRVDLAYTSRSRAVAVLGSPVSSVEVDGAALPKSADASSILLPSGQHVLTLIR
jgi:hypothetical protein